jgi:hypothetical protein
VRPTADQLFWTTIVLSGMLLALESLALRYLGAAHPCAWDALGRRRVLNHSVQEHLRFAAFFWLGGHRRLADPRLNRLGVLLQALSVAIVVCAVSLYAVVG